MITCAGKIGDGQKLVANKPPLFLAAVFNNLQQLFFFRKRGGIS